MPPTNTGGMMAASAVLMCGSAHTGIVSEMAVDATNGSLPSMSLEKSPAFAAQVVVEMYLVIRATGGIRLAASGMYVNRIL